MTVLLARSGARLAAVAPTAAPPPLSSEAHEAAETTTWIASRAANPIYYLRQPDRRRHSPYDPTPPRAWVRLAGGHLPVPESARPVTLSGIVVGPRPFRDWRARPDAGGG